MTKLDLNTRRQVRRIANADNNLPVVVVPGNAAPTRKGSSYHWETRGGTRIMHPSAYSRKGWSNIVYCGSTRRVEVGQDWLASHMGRGQWQADLIATVF